MGRTRLPDEQAETSQHELHAGRNQNQELTHEQHRIQEIVRMVAHDLRSPMQDIELVLGIAAETPDHCVDERSLHVARHALSRIGRLVNDLMTSSRSRDSSLPLEARPVDVAMPVREAIEPLKARALATGLALYVEVPAITLPVQADADRIEQVVTNLVVNAIKFTPPPGPIRVAVRTCCNHASIRVSDSGPGMSSEDVPKAFEPFWQAPEGAHEGVGLGLSIAHEIVRVHRGRIWLESEPGRGTDVTFTLPLAL